MSGSSTVNFASATGIDSVAGAIIFAVLYVPPLGYFAFQSFKLRSRIVIVLTLFCAIRIAAFIIRAILAGVESAGENLGLLIADDILIGVGFFSLLYPAYALVLDREESLDNQPPRNIISSITRNRRVFRMIMALAVALGITGSNLTSPSNIDTGLALRKASTIIFLVLTILQAIRTLILIKIELSVSSRYRRAANESFGTTHGVYILLAISVFLMIREIYSTVTISSPTKPTNEKTWYPLFALPEWLAVICYATPGLSLVLSPGREIWNYRIRL
ncbi:hypothetical protein BDQ17DRAFT_1392501 [Cyathus striatus]|nr:hypothetical protein BDQ17DRAFT_1392501 [Cyathus striatus]